MDTTKTPAPNAPEPDSKESADAAVTATTATDVEVTDIADVVGDQDGDLDGDESDDFLNQDNEDRPTGVFAAASAIAGAGLSLVALSGTWVARVISERQGLIGQIESVNATSMEQKINALYSDGWHQTALVNGVFSTIALLIGMFVLVGPSFGAPGRVNPNWVKAVSWVAVAIGLIGVLIFGLMYFDLLLDLPKAAAPAA
ncbi:hypothetical protein OHS33_25790 [Streptomyces sp. NBC_00536]|uniref:hypothetical protein n=1 Tax=Streptomyces sp. NBC_00536 TaxID=2975769 RepID=UPI002E81010D|nr:hypothetical protein [Streptomyces sp. NBC_00536]WUC81447.1 hypothetical protein OHS33_25790 [Streptomyces sp. NBC_00536]